MLADIPDQVAWCIWKILTSFACAREAFSRAREAFARAREAQDLSAQVSSARSNRNNMGHPRCLCTTYLIPSDSTGQVVHGYVIAVRLYRTTEILTTYGMPEHEQSTSRTEYETVTCLHGPGPSLKCFFYSYASRYYSPHPIPRRR
jgi:hypothetical protein